jgi:phosphoribosylformimino-5-aminoimidazole carboxamide ribonucleotide (ProFAR) isomerase/protein-L-isoaspartate O-methyltransferase
VIDPARVFDILPTLHLSGGQLVDLATETSGDTPRIDSTDPLAAARLAVEHGARWIHVINVDATFDPEAGHDWGLLAELCTLPVKVQYGGGISHAGNIDKAIAAGVSRVLLNTVATRSPEVVSDAIIQHGRERFAVAITTHPEGGLATSAASEWQAVGGQQALTLAIQMSQLGITTLVHSRVEPDGTMSGTELDSSCELAELSGMDVIVGGEVRDIDDVVACYNSPGITGVLIGKALQTGKIGLGEALDETRATLAFESGMPTWKEAQQTLEVRLRRALTRRFLAEHLSKTDGLRVLDAGGGNGIDSIALAEAGAHITVVDRSAAMLQDLDATAEAAGLQHRVSAHKLDIREISTQFDKHAFDLLICHNVIQYSSEWEAMLESMLAPLRSGGRLSLVVRNWFAEPYRINIDEQDAGELPAMFERVRGPSRVFDTDVLFFSAPFLLDWFSSRGYEILAHNGLLCRHAELPLAESPGAEQLVLEKLEALESMMGQRSPYRDTARYVQIIARKRFRPPGVAHELQGKPQFD